MPIISALVIKAPTQCDRSISSCAGDAGEEVLVAAGEADDLVREDRPDDERDVGLGDVPVDLHVDRGVGQQPAGELGQPLGGDGAQVVNVSGSHDSWLRIRQPG